MVRSQDLIGQKFGKLLVLEACFRYDCKNTYFKCKCDCGNTKYILASNVKKGKSKSCGCYERSSRFSRDHKKNRKGQRFGKLTLAKDTLRRTPSGGVIWECLCDCGNKIDLPLTTIQRRKTPSCDECYEHPLAANVEGQKFGYLTAIQPVKQRQKGQRTSWICLCECGNIVTATTEGLISHNTTSCGCKNKSWRVFQIADLLNSLNIVFQQEKTFDDCTSPINGRPLFFDFYLPEHSTIIEYDGRQHYHPIPFWGGTDAYCRRIYYDRYKNNYCLNRGLNICRIPYTSNTDDIEDTINRIKNP